MFTNLTPMDWKRRAIKYYPDKTAVIDDEKNFTYKEFGRRVDQLSIALTKAGVIEKDHVAVMLPNTHYMLECFYGIGQLGAVMVPLNYRLSADDLHYIIEQSDSKMLIVDAEFAEPIEQIVDDLSLDEIIVVAVEGIETTINGLDYETFISHGKNGEVPDVDIDENQLLTINYTSGTTSKPKGVMLTHRGNYVNAANFMYHLNVVSEDVYLHTLPMFHCNGWGGVWAITAAGGTHICLRKIDPEKILRLFEEQHVSMLCGAPTVINMLINHPKAKEVNITTNPVMATAGAPPAAALIQKAQELLGLNMIHAYGLTETSPFILYCEWRKEFDTLSPDEQAAIKARQGIELAFNGETKVIHQDGTEVAWDGKDLGEIITRGNVVMDGYYKDIERTEAVMKDGWFHTGDLAVTYPNGYVEIRDRAKDMIISGGENISSTEIEGLLFKHPDVLEAAVIAVPDETWGEVPLAIIVAQPNSHISEQGIIDYCREHLAHFKAPKRVEIVNELPKTATGKLQKFRLREMYWKGPKRVN